MYVPQFLPALLSRNASHSHFLHSRYMLELTFLRSGPLRGALSAVCPLPCAVARCRASDRWHVHERVQSAGRRPPSLASPCPRTAAARAQGTWHSSIATVPPSTRRLELSLAGGPRHWACIRPPAFGPNSSISRYSSSPSFSTPTKTAFELTVGLW